MASFKMTSNEHSPIQIIETHSLSDRPENGKLGMGCRLAEKHGVLFSLQSHKQCRSNELTQFSSVSSGAMR